MNHCKLRQHTSNAAVPGRAHLYMASISSFSRWEMTTTTLPPSMRYAWHTCNAFHRVRAQVNTSDLHLADT